MKIVKIIKLLAINIAVLAILLVTLNWVCGVYLKRSNATNRFELPNYANDPKYAEEVFGEYRRVKHRYEPFVGWRALPFSGKTLYISPAGIRSHEKKPTHDGTSEVVRFFGGSTMWGEGSDDQHTIPALFNLHHPQYRVYNHGQLAFNTRQELDELISVYSRNEKADLVIFYDGVNDAAFLCPKVIEELPAHRLVPMYRDRLYTRQLHLVKELVSKIFIDNILNSIKKITYVPSAENALYDCTSNPKKAEAIAEMMMKNWEMAHELVTNRNGRFIAILQPAAYIGKPRTDHLMLDEELGKNFKEIYRLLRKKIAERNHPWIIDLSAIFDNDEYIFIDFCHVSPNGNEIIASEIAQVVNSLQD